MPDADPENDLERALLQAVDNPEARDAFERLFFASVVHLPYSGPRGGTEHGHVRSSVEVEGVRCVAVFSAVSRVGMAASMLRDVRFIGQTSVQRLIREVPGVNLALNPGSTGKLFLAQEIKARQAERRPLCMAKTSGEALMTVPRALPQHIVVPLARYLRTEPDVTRASLRQFTFLADAKRPLYAITLTASHDHAEIGSRVTDVLGYLLEDDEDASLDVTSKRSGEHGEDFYRT